MVDVQTISVVIAAASVVVGVITFIVNSQKEARQRQIEFLFQRTQSDLEAYYEAWHDVVNTQDWENFDELNEKYSLREHPKERARFNYIGHFYNSLGLLLKEKVINPDLFFNVFSPGMVMTTWKKYEPVVKQMRNEGNIPIIWNGFEYLGNEVERRYPGMTRLRVGPRSN